MTPLLVEAVLVFEDMFGEDEDDVRIKDVGWREMK